MACLAVALCGASGAAHAQATEAAVKAAFLYKFSGYVEWPPGSFGGPDMPFVIAVAGAPEVAEELGRLVPRRSVHNRRIEVRRATRPEDLRGVHVLFAGRQNGDTAAILRAARDQRILTVGEGERGIEQGSVISFVKAGDNVGFEVSLDAAERAGLRISSRMLAVARRVAGRG